MLVSTQIMLARALKGKYAVAQFNVNNLEWLRGILEAATEMRAPVILGVTESAARYMGGVSTAAAMIIHYVSNNYSELPLALHLDHSSQYACLEAVGAGFTSVMFDGSAMPFAENLLICRALAEFCHKRGVSLEAELGSPAGEEDGISGTGARASVLECTELAQAAIDSLAPAIGNIHGQYPADWKGLEFELLEKIHNSLPALPLVLHGGTGIPDKQIKRAIANGICKINVNTECQLAFSLALHEYFERGEDRKPKGYNPQIMFKPAIDAIRKKACEKIGLFGSEGKICQDWPQ